MGGLPRRATFLKDEGSGGQRDLVLDSGNIFVDRAPSEAALGPAMEKSRLIVELMSGMGYEATALGEMDLYLGLENLRALEDLAGFHFLSANLVDADGGALFARHRLFSKGPLTIGVFGLTSPPANKALFEERMGAGSVLDPLETASRVLSEIRDRCDLVVVLSSLGFNRDQGLAKAVPGIDVIIGGKSKRFMRKPVIVEGTLVTTGYFQGRAVGKLRVSLQGEHKGWVSEEELDFLQRQIDTARERIRGPGDEERVARLEEKQEKALGLTRYAADMVQLVPDIQDHPEVAARILQYRKDLKKGQSPGTRGGGPRPVRYIGATKCSGCHEGRFTFWSRTPHWAAFRTLSTRDAEADPDCLPCHVTGYERQTGYWPKAPRIDLEGVQCEACHGVGSLHAQSPETYSLLHRPTAPLCLDCHTEEQDDDFNFLRDRGKICAEG